MKVEKISLLRLKLPMKFAFQTAKGLLKERETLVIVAEDGKSNKGYGEVVSFTMPFYTSETLADSWQALNSYIPQILTTNLDHPFDVHKRFEKPLPMAVAGLENALLDLYYKEKGENTIASLFAEKLASKIERGAVLGLSQPLTAIEDLKTAGVSRIKFKAEPGSYPKVKEAVETYPDLTFALDANRSFTEKDLKELRKLDQLGLACIEEPVADLSLYQKLRLQTPVCFDESVQNLEQLQTVSKLPVTVWLNIKIGRLGGLYQTRQIIDYCREHQIPFWIGSMLESGISKILHVQLAALSGNIMPGDLSDSSHYFEADLIEPALSFHHGKMTVPKKAGLGVAVREDLLDEYCMEKRAFDKFS